MISVTLLGFNINGKDWLRSAAIIAVEYEVDLAAVQEKAAADPIRYAAATTNSLLQKECDTMNEQPIAEECDTMNRSGIKESGIKESSLSLHFDKVFG